MTDEPEKPLESADQSDPQLGPVQPDPAAAPPPPPSNTWGARALDWIEWAGNKLPDPAILFLYCIVITCVVSALLAPVEFSEIDPRTQGLDREGKPQVEKPIRVQNQLSGTALVAILKGMVKTFVEFPPLGVVLVALLGVGVAEHTGFINACIKGMLGVTPARLLTPMLLLVAIVSHSAGDTGYVLVIPLGGVIFAAAGRHPLAGIVAAFAGVSDGFSANFLPSGLDPLLQGFTQTAAQIISPTYTVNPLCNWGFTAISSILVVGAGWYLTDRVIEPKLRRTPVDGDPQDMPVMDELKPEERRGMVAGLAALVAGLLLLPILSWPEGSPLRSEAGWFQSDEFVRAAQKLQEGTAATADSVRSEADWQALYRRLDADNDQKLYFSEVPPEDREHVEPIFELANKATHRSLVAHGSPLMDAIVPLIFLLFLIPGVVHGYVAGTVKSHRDIIKGMSKSMSTMGYYLVLAFFAAQFTFIFTKSNLGALVAIKGAGALKALNMPDQVTIVGIILLSTLVNLLIGSASAKWALLGPIFVPMLMQLGLSPELTQAAYRVGDSSTNIITPLLPYFPLIVVYCQRYVKGTGIGTLVSLMVPYSLTFLVTWTALLLIYWAIGLPLGLQAPYYYVAP